MKRKTRLAIVVSHPIQHFVHFYRALALLPDLELCVFYATDIGVKRYFDEGMGVEITWKADMLSGYQYQILPEAGSIKHTDFWSVNNPSIGTALAAFAPDVVKIHGYAQATLLRALLWCRMNRVPALIWTDSELVHQRSAIKQFVKRLVLVPLLAQFAGVLTVGDNNEAYFRHYGVPQNKLYRTPFTIDEETFKLAAANRADIRVRWRSRLGISADAFVVLCVGKLIERKRPADLVEALKLLGRRRGAGSRQIVGVFAGDGALKERLQLAAREVEDSCRFLGFVNLDELPEAYVMSDALGHLSEMDPHPLTTSEASLVGLPLIISDRVGALGPTDTARPGVNALSYACGDIEALAAAMQRLADDPNLYDKMHEASLRVAAELNVDASVAGIMRAIRAVVLEQR